MGGAIISESGGGIIPLRGAASSRNRGAASPGISRMEGPWDQIDPQAQIAALDILSRLIAQMLAAGSTLETSDE
jgi:hypothetical protein